MSDSKQLSDGFSKSSGCGPHDAFSTEVVPFHLHQTGREITSGKAVVILRPWSSAPAELQQHHHSPFLPSAAHTTTTIIIIIILILRLLLIIITSVVSGDHHRHRHRHHRHRHHHHGRRRHHNHPSPSLCHYVANQTCTQQEANPTALFRDLQVGSERLDATGKVDSWAHRRVLVFFITSARFRFGPRCSCGQIWHKTFYQLRVGLNMYVEMISCGIPKPNDLRIRMDLSSALLSAQDLLCCHCASFLLKTKTWEMQALSW